MSTIWQRVFWKDTATKTVKTIAQTAGGIIVAGPVANIFTVDWVGIVSASGLAGLACVLMNIGTSDGPDE